MINILFYSIQERTYCSVISCGLVVKFYPITKDEGAYHKPYT